MELNDTEVAKHILLGHECSNCVYRTNDYKMLPEGECCTLDGSEYDNTIIYDNFCSMYASNILWAPNDFFKEVCSNKDKEPSEYVRAFVASVRKYTG